jgi:sugar transferase (PEP-CTERM/EpsH1 system associated)
MRLKVLFLTHRLPFAPNRGDRVRAFHMVKLLAKHFDLTVASLVHDQDEEAQAATVQRMGARVVTAPFSRPRNLARASLAVWGRTPLTHVLLDSPGMRDAIAEATRDDRPDVVLSYCSGMAQYCLAPPLAGLPLVMDFVDVDSAKWAAFSESASPPMAWVQAREARYLSTFEARAARASSAAVVVNERERETLRRLSPDANVQVVPNGVDVAGLLPPNIPASEPRVVFQAVFNYAPNVDGALWFAREVWPRVRAAIPTAQFTLAGAYPTRAVRKLAMADRSIEVTGSVDDIRPYLWRSAVAVAPMFQARGVQNKVLEAAAAGLPSVVTPAVWGGLPHEVLPACRLAETASEFAAAVVSLLSMKPEARRQQAMRAQLTSLGWPQRLSPLLGLIEAAARTDRVGRGL